MRSGLKVKLQGAGRRRGATLSPRPHPHPHNTKMAEQEGTPSTKVTDTPQQPGSLEEESEKSSSESRRDLGTAVDPATATTTTAEETTLATVSQDNFVPRCTFCRIITKQLHSEIVYEDSEYICFTDRSPASTHHYLVVPRQHIRDARALSTDQLPIIERMAELGKRVLAERGGSVDDVRMGFHWPPFLMVRHIHLHVISPASQMGWLHRNIVFRQDSFAFTSPTATIDYLRRTQDK